ncbi:MAG: T9SS type A sorting domain-containing protein [Flavobacteriales bacterium]|nr:T9SS type A sorting domain-containing protein [Flavobacteriales bacterium]
MNCLIRFFIGVFLIIVTNISSAQSPGNESNDLNLWLKADDNGGVVIDNTTITTWVDQSGNGNNGTNLSAPKYRDAAAFQFNYNPSVYLDGSSLFTLPDATISPADANYSFFVVFRNDLTANKHTLVHAGENNLNEWITIRLLSDGGIHDRFNNTGSNNSPAGVVTANEQTLSHFTYSTTLNNKKTYLDGALIAQLNGVANKNTKTTFNSVGGHWDDDNSLFKNFYLGEIAEVIVYNERKESSTIKEQIESYLAVKYGITLDNSAGGTAGDYLGTNGATMWDASLSATYHNNVIGIGRDDDEALEQKQSHTLNDTTRIYLNTLQASNAANTGSFSSDISYVLVGDNQGKMCHTPAAATEKPVGIYSRLEREWKVTKTNFSGSFSGDFTLNACAIPASVTPADLRLLVDDDGDFSNATIYAAGGGLSFSYSGGIITVSGISTTQIPNNTTKYITIASVDAATPLPVELLYFNAKPVNQTKVQLDWQTVTEINNDYFTVERSRDAVSWEDLLEVDGAGNSSVTLNYINFDNAPYRGTSYYRLKQTDFDGASSKSQIVPVLIQGIDIVNVYPNPGVGKINLIINSTLSSTGSLTIYDKIGKVVYQEKITLNKGINKVSSDVSFLVEGSYTIRASINNEKYFDHELYMVGINN